MMSEGGSAMLNDRLAQLTFFAIPSQEQQRCLACPEPLTTTRGGRKKLSRPQILLPAPSSPVSEVSFFLAHGGVDAVVRGALASGPGRRSLPRVSLSRPSLSLSSLRFAVGRRPTHKCIVSRSIE